MASNAWNALDDGNVSLAAGQVQVLTGAVPVEEWLSRVVEQLL